MTEVVLCVMLLEVVDDVITLLNEVIVVNGSVGTMDTCDITTGNCDYCTATTQYTQFYTFTVFAAKELKCNTRSNV